MRKYLLVILSFMIFPILVFANENCEEMENENYCKGPSCLSSLQSDYNTWNSFGNVGKSCIKVISVIKGNERSYLSGKNPEQDYKCSDGSLAIGEKQASAIPNESEVTDCNTEACYVPEIWLMDCGSSEHNTSNDNVLDSGNTDNSNNDNLNEDVNTNEDGQITGTTDSSETGVETYFAVLFVMLIISYLVLLFSKKSNLFKNI